MAAAQGMLTVGLGLVVRAACVPGTVGLQQLDTVPGWLPLSGLNADGKIHSSLSVKKDSACPRASE